jgi:hypothetical protein
VRNSALLALTAVWISAQIYWPPLSLFSKFIFFNGLGVKG